MLLKLSGSPLVSEIRKSIKDIESYMTPNKSNKSINMTNINNQ